MNQSKLRALLDNKSVAPWHVHALGLFITFMIILLIGLSWSLSERVIENRTKSAEGLSLREAVSLLERRGQIHENFQEIASINKQLILRANQINSWMPSSQETILTSLNQFQEIAEQSGLIVVDVSELQTIESQRVSVAAAEFRVTGSFSNLCRWINELHQTTVPGWAHKLSLIRRAEGDFQASVSIRIPFHLRADTRDNLDSDPSLNKQASKFNGALAG